jgi:transcriptional regulator with XRE-family HTH domain
MENQTIGARIKQRRKELGLTQLQIKQETGISSGNMSDIENGNKLPSTPALISLSKVLNCSIDWILKGELSSQSNIVLTDERIHHLLEGFQELSDEDKEELIEIMDLKLRKSQRAREVSSKSFNMINDSGMTG